MAAHAISSVLFLHPTSLQVLWPGRSLTRSRYWTLVGDRATPSIDRIYREHLPQSVQNRKRLTPPWRRQNELLYRLPTPTLISPSEIIPERLSRSVACQSRPSILDQSISGKPGLSMFNLLASPIRPVCEPIPYRFLPLLPRHTIERHYPALCVDQACVFAVLRAVFELIAARYERRSLLITANQPFGEWGKIFSD